MTPRPSAPDLLTQLDDYSTDLTLPQHAREALQQAAAYIRRGTRQKHRPGHPQAARDDREWSLQVRTRDNWACLWCGRKHQPFAGTLQAAHIFRRTKPAIRYDPRNGISVCSDGVSDCHGYLDENRDVLHAFALELLGWAVYLTLESRSEELTKIVPRRWVG
jgi:hypothetical protein